MEWIAQYGGEWRMLARTALAMLLGAIIGFERETKDKPAGLRTHMLVAGAAALLTLLGGVVIADLHRSDMGTDPLRIVSAVVTGISFLGAGTIMRRQQAERVEGLTTAASLLITAAIGVAVALARPALAVGTTALALVTLWLVNILEHRIQAD